MELVEHQHLARPLHGHERGHLDDLVGRRSADERSLPLDLTDVGMLARQRQTAVAAGAVAAVRAQEGGGEGACRGSLARSRRPHEQVGVDGIGHRGLEQRDGAPLADDPAPQLRADRLLPHRLFPR